MCIRKKNNFAFCIYIFYFLYFEYNQHKKKTITIPLKKESINLKKNNKFIISNAISK